MHNQAQIVFHKKWLDHVRKSIGASYLAYEEYGGLYDLKAVINGKTIKVKLEGTPQDVTSESYKNLINQFLGLENGQ